jgi:chemotaxis methyl-accepting protein methylase
VSVPVVAEPEPVEPVLAAVREAIGLDFSCYRPATVRRRIRNRMLMVGAETIEEYFALVSGSRDEAWRLAERITIKVSRFYRNAGVFDTIRRDLLPALAARRPRVDVWVAGCGCGEEAWTFAMLLDELGCAGRVVATDIDAAALETAARGAYPAAAAAELPADLASRGLHTVRSGASVAVSDALRGRVRFELHDLVSAPRPPMPERFALVSCRNVLIYLLRGAQVRALALLRRALDDRGVLVLGEAEWPVAPIEASLEAVAPRSRIFAAAAAVPGGAR